MSQHLSGAADRSCDHWHDGAGLMVHHMAFTRAMEEVLQLVSPSISMPYWEYAQDQFNFASDWQKVWIRALVHPHHCDITLIFPHSNPQSEVFQTNWFGSAAPKGDDHGLDGIWQNLRVSEDSWDAPVHNSYGQLRSPWNLAPSNRVTRIETVFGMTS